MHIPCGHVLKFQKLHISLSLSSILQVMTHQILDFIQFPDTIFICQGQNVEIQLLSYIILLKDHSSLTASTNPSFVGLTLANGKSCTVMHFTRPPPEIGEKCPSMFAGAHCLYIGQPNRDYLTEAQHVRC
jgi:hypothetical protein